MVLCPIKWVVASYLLSSAKIGAWASRECDSCDGVGSFAFIYAGIPGDSPGVESISSRPSVPRSQRVSTCRWRSSGDQRWMETKDVYLVFNRRRSERQVESNCSRSADRC